MHKFQGTLVVERINGKRGPFCVGMLKIDIGQFKVKDQELEQFEPGSYTGQFIVEEIYTRGVPWRGGTFTELLAKIAEGGFLIDEENQSDEVPAVQAEPDPADEDVQQPSQEVTDKPKAKSRSKIAPRVDVEPNLQDKTGSDEADLNLFGVDLYPLFAQGAEIALDPTVDRLLFRQQRERLKTVGYKFNHTTQRWVFAV